MHRRHRHHVLSSIFLSAAAATALVGCGGGGDDTPAPPPPSPPAPVASPSCSSLLSGTYRVIVPSMAAAGQFSTETMTIDAATGVTRAVNDPSDVGQLTPTATNCVFTGSSGPGAEVVVSSAGVVVFRSVEAGGVMRLGLAFREQTIPVADLAGNWQMLGFERGSGGTYAAVAGAGSISSTGAITLTRYCPTLQTCAPVTSPPSLTLQANAAGGFNLVQPGNDPSRTFAYRSPSGDLMLVDLAGNGSVSIWAQQRTLTLPAVSSRSATWGLWTNPSLVSTSAASLSDFTITALDAATGSYSRVSNIDGHTETLNINTPYAGLSFRAEGTATTSTGATVAVREFTALPVRGMGLSVLSLPTLGGGAFFFSVATP